MITLDRVSKIFRSATSTIRAVDDVSLEISAGELCVLIGPSGSGKTTTLRMINRLEVPTSGQINVNGRDISRADPVRLRRTIGYVIQQVGLLPHLTVSENVALVPRLLGWPARKRRVRAEEMLQLVGLPPRDFAARYPRELSGGQQQRVAVARALAGDPPIVLMDEPFGALDPLTRKQLQHELRRIHAEVRKTIVFITHDVSEAFLLGDRIALMAEGRIVQYGTPPELLRQPATPFVTEFIGDDRGMLTLRHVRMAELAGPVRNADAKRGLRIHGSCSVLDALHRIAAARSDDDGLEICDDRECVIGYLCYADLVRRLADVVIAEGEVGGYPDALPAR
jgi:osmoprotectant transport system ATP-binding protein